MWEQEVVEFIHKNIHFCFLTCSRSLKHEWFCLQPFQIRPIWKYLLITVEHTSFNKMKCSHRPLNCSNDQTCLLEFFRKKPNVKEPQTQIVTIKFIQKRPQCRKHIYSVWMSELSKPQTDCKTAITEKYFNLRDVYERLWKTHLAKTLEQETINSNGFRSYLI